MAEARQLKTGRWRLYKTPSLYPVRDPETGRIATFESLAEARRWFRLRFPQEGPAHEAIKCARCGAYFGQDSTCVLVGGFYYHLGHAPQLRGAGR